MMLSALDLARRIEAGELAPAEVIARCAETIAARDPEIGAFVALDLVAARRAAAAPGLAQTPLRGLPVGIKDVYDTVDFPTEYGTPIYAGHRPKTDAALVALVRRAGGIVLGKTVTTELQSLQPAGTRNPHNLAHTPGGSSSGSVAAVAAGMVAIATGSQTGGSVIRPHAASPASSHPMVAANRQDKLRGHARHAGLLRPALRTWPCPRRSQA
jgi:Asp-tRNA(Asn)/Glu-tRNA(Gln) amidotransferase A subunit family amidase